MRFALAVSRLAVLAALVMGCGLFQGLTNPGPETTAAFATFKADAATLRYHLEAAGGVVTDAATLAGQIDNRDFLGASTTLISLATQAAAVGKPIVADVRRLVDDLAAVYAAASSGKDATVGINLAKARAILDASGS